MESLILNPIQMKRISLLILAFAGFLSSFAQTIFSDDFNRTSIGSNWVVRYGNWSIENNMLKHVGDGTFDANFILFAQSILSTEYTVECKVMWKQNGFFEDGISFFHKPQDIVPGNPWGRQDNYYLAYLSTYNGNEARLARLNPNTSSVRMTDIIYPDLETPVNTNTWFSLKVEVRKFNSEYVEIKYYVFNKLVLWMAGTVDALLADNVGLGGFKGQYGQVVYFDDFIIYGSGGYTGIGEKGIQSSDKLKIYPNPFSSVTTIEFTATQTTDTQLEIYNQTGELIKKIRMSNVKIGLNQIIWDGKNSLGQTPAKGTYYLQVINGKSQMTGKVTLM
jgi:hypothetical protein